MALGLLPPYVLRPLLLIVGLGAAHLYGLPVNARFAIVAAILASLGAAIVQTLLLRHRLQRELAPGPRRYAFALWFKTALPFWLIVAWDLTLQNADVLVISSYLGPAAVGLYSAAAKTMSLVLFIPYAVAKRDGQPDRRPRRARRGGRPARRRGRRCQLDLLAIAARRGRHP